MKTVLEPGMITHCHLDKSFFFSLSVTPKYWHQIYSIYSFEGNTFEVRNCWTDGYLVVGESVIVG